MLSLVVRVIATLGVMVGTGVLLYNDDRVLGAVITGLTVGMLVFGVVGLGIGAVFVVRGIVRSLFAAPEPPTPAQRPVRLTERVASGRL